MNRRQLLDTEEEEVFDGIAQLTTRLFDVPLASISLIDSERHFNKAKVGPMPPEVRGGSIRC